MPSFKPVFQIPAFLMLLFGAVNLFAQTEECLARQNQRFSKVELSTPMRESLYKLCVEEEKKEFDELVRRTEEAARLTEQLSKTFDEKNELSGDDLKKLDKLEKLVNKIRNGIGATEDKYRDKEKVAEDDTDDAPSDMVELVGLLKERSAALLDEVKKTTRRSVSVVAVQTSNAVLKLVKILRFKK